VGLKEKPLKLISRHGDFKLFLTPLSGPTLRYILLCWRPLDCFSASTYIKEMLQELSDFRAFQRVGCTNSVGY
jgi:hypothetical protein